MKRNRKYSLGVYSGLGFLAVICGICIFLPPQAWFVEAQENYYQAYWRKHKDIVDHESLTAFFTFDEPELPEYSDGHCREEWYGIIDHASTGVVKTKGRHGDGIKFNGDNDTFYAFAASWPEIPKAFSIAFWMRLSPLPCSQDIFCTWDPKHMGFRLDRGELAFSWTAPKAVESISYHFDKYKEYVHIAVVADRETGSIRLYENGVCVAEGDCSDLVSFRWFFALGKGNFSRNREPLHGVIDDLAIWDRAISETELREIVASPYGLQEHFSSASERFSLEKKRVRAKLKEKVGRCVACFLSSISSWGDLRGDLGANHQVSIYLPDSSWRSLARLHAQSMRSGILVSREYVDAFVTMDGQTLECEMSLAGGTMCYPYTDRLAYVLKPIRAEVVFPGGYRRIELLPPEKAGWLMPLAISSLRNQCNLGDALRKDCNLAQLEINGLMRGIYLVRDATHMCVCQDDPPEILHYSARKQPFRQRDAEKEYWTPTVIDDATLRLGAMFSPQRKELVEKQLSCTAKILEEDHFSPVPVAFRTAIREQLALFQKDMAENVLSDIDNVPVSSSMMLGSNLCAWCITDALDFSCFTNMLPHGIAVAIQSDNTNLISNAGAVVRPAEHPELVTVTVSLTNERGFFRVVPMEFRVLPRKGLVPAIFVWSPILFGRAHQTDAALEIFADNGQNGLECCFDDFAKIRYRGNSSFFLGKKLLRIKTESPHHWFGKTGAKHMLAINASTDSLRVWNRLAFDLFRSFPRSGGVSNCAPHVGVAELFVNGRYWSLVEFAERLDEHLWGDPDYFAFRQRIASPRHPFMRQLRPDISSMDVLDMELDFETLLASTDRSAESLRRIKSKLDVTNIIDHMLLFSLFSNANGGASDFWMQECLMYDPSTGRYFYIPWDFDDSMRTDLGLIETNLDRLLAATDPEYNELVLKRWRELRATVLSTDSVLARYNDIVGGHAAYLPFEYNAWHVDKKEWDDIVGSIGAGREKIAYRLEKMDRLLAERCDGER